MVKCPFVRENFKIIGKKLIYPPKTTRVNWFVPLVSILPLLSFALRKVFVSFFVER